MVPRRSEGKPASAAPRDDNAKRAAKIRQDQCWRLACCREALHAGVVAGLVPATPIFFGTEQNNGGGPGKPGHAAHRLAAGSDWIRERLPLLVDDHGSIRAMGRRRLALSIGDLHWRSIGEQEVAVRDKGFAARQA